MTIRTTRRTIRLSSIIFSCAMATALSTAAVTVYAQKPTGLPNGYPNRPIRIVVGFIAGGGVDIVMRVFAQQMSESWSNTVVVENRPGSSSAIAMGVVANAPADGYTILGGTNSAIYSMLLGTTPYDMLKVYDPVVKLTSQAYLLLVGSTLPVNSVKELIAYAKARPGQVSFASSGVGSPSHLGMELFKSTVGMPAVHVPYKGIPQALADMVSGQITMSFGLLISALPQVKSGRLKALAITSLHRSQLLPDVPTIAETAAPNFELTGEYGLYVPKGTPPAIVLALNKEGARIMQSPIMKERLASDGAEPAAPNSPTQYRESLAKTIKVLGDFIKTSGFKGE